MRVPAGTLSHFKSVELPPKNISTKKVRIWTALSHAYMLSWEAMMVSAAGAGELSAIAVQHRVVVNVKIRLIIERQPFVRETVPETFQP